MMIMLFFLVSIKETNMIDFSLNGHKKDKTTVLFLFFTICFLVTTFIITLTLSLYFMGSFFLIITLNQSL